MGAAAGSSGNGNTLVVDLADAVVTYGDRSMGVVAQSIGGGGGYLTAPAQNIANTGVAENPGISNSTGGPVTVNVEAGGSITTSGAGAWGILAQSVGGGGGLAGDPSLSMQFPQSNTLSSPTLSGNAYANTVTVDVAGNITTTGANAHGIFAQSVGGSGGIAAGCCNSTTASLLAGNNAQFRSTSNATYGGAGGAVDITQSAGSTIKTSGLGAIGIVTQSSGVSGEVGTITIGIGGTVIGGTNGGQAVASGAPGAAGILVSGGVNSSAGGANTVSVASGGSVSTMDGINGTAIIAGYGVTNVVNSGTIEGNINLNEAPGAPGALSGTITNNAGGVVNPGNTLVASTLSNSGRINLPDFQVNLTGSFVQNSSGTLAFDFRSPTGTMLAVSGSAALGGTVMPTVATSLQPVTETLLTSPSPSVSAAVTHPLLFGWNLQNTGNAITITPTSNFMPQGVPLDGNEVSLASYLTRAWNDADPALGGFFASLYNGVPNGSSYTSLLDQLSPRATQVAVAALDDQAGTMLGSAMSCPEFEDGTTLIEEGSCVWTKTSGQVTNEYNESGSVTSTTYRIGGQGAIAPNWRLGGAFGAGVIWADEGNQSKGSGNVYDGSVALKYSAGPWLVAGSLALANGAYTNSRAIDLPGVTAILNSNSEAFFVGGRVRAAYNVPRNGWYVRPMGDLDVYYTQTPAFNETGPAPYALAIQSSSKVNVTFTPAVEVGSRINIDRNSTLRAYADLGLSVIPDNRRTIAANFASASVDDGAFQTTIKSPNVTGNLDVGVQLYHASGLDVRVEYNLRGGDSFLSQGGTARLAYRF